MSPSLGLGLILTLNRKGSLIAVVHNSTRFHENRLKTVLRNPVHGRREVIRRTASFPTFNPFTADPVKALHFAILV